MTVDNINALPNKNISNKWEHTSWSRECTLVEESWIWQIINLEAYRYVFSWFARYIPFVM